MKNSSFSPLRIIAGSLIIMGAVACNNNPNNGNDNTESNSRMEHQQMADRKDDSTFMAKANNINMEEIKLGNLAKDKSSNESVDQLADMIVADHTQNNQNLSGLASKKSIRMTSTLSDDAQDAYNKLNDLSGTDFDNEYADMMVKGHKKAISLFEKDSADINDSDIREYAVNTLPKLRAHLSKAQACQEMLNDAK